MSDDKRPTPPKRRLGTRMLEAKVGAFFVGVVALGVGLVLLLATKRNVFEQEVVLHAAFSEVQGLKEGAPVRLSGVNVGMVSRIDFASGADGKPLVAVDLKISRARLCHVHEDSIAHIDAQGLLGDKIIELSIGSKDSPTLAPGGTVHTIPPSDIGKLIGQAGDILVQVKRVADNAAAISDGLTDPTMTKDLKAAVGSISRLMAATDKGTGLAHALFYDRRTADQFSQLMLELNQLVAHVDNGVARIDTVLAATDEHGAQLLNNLSRAAKSVGDTAADLHRSKVIGHLDHASGDLSDLAAYVKAGKGSLGALIMDPTAYEQLVTVLGGVARSRVLRALVRYAIFKDDGQGTARVVDGPPRKAEHTK